MVWRAASAMLLLAVTGWAQAPADGQQVVPLRSPFLQSAARGRKPDRTPRTKRDAQKPAAGNSKPATGGAVVTLARQALGGQSRERRARPIYHPVSPASAAAAVCTSGGKRCLMIDRISLKGVVRSESGFIAVVVNAANRAYFLRENDPLMNGYVVRITSSAVTFKETGKDRSGHSFTRDVTLTLNGPAA